MTICFLQSKECSDQVFFNFQIVTFMVMSVIAAVFTTVPIALSAASIPLDLKNWGFENYENEVNFLLGTVWVQKINLA